MFAFFIGFATSAYICIDPGHGGSDPGATYNGRTEASDVLRLSNEVARRLRSMGHSVYMTRTGDYFVGLSQRASAANSRGCTAFVSIHRNAYQPEQAKGYETYIYNGGVGATTHNLANNIHTRVVSKGVSYNRGIKRANYAVLRQTNMPATLLEVLFVDNSGDNRLFDSKFSSYAQAIAEGISATF